MPSEPESEAYTGINLLIRFHHDEGTLEILHASRASEAPSPRLRSDERAGPAAYPQLAIEFSAQAADDSAPFLSIESHTEGTHQERTSFHDLVESDQQDRLGGGLHTHTRHDVRMLHIAVPRAARKLRFTIVELDTTSDAEGTEVAEAVGPVFDLGSLMSDRGSAPVYSPDLERAAPDAAPVPAAAAPASTAPCMPAPPAPQPVDGCSLAKSFPIWNDSRKNGLFNIVILADGFQESEQDMLKSFAQSLILGNKAVKSATSGENTTGLLTDIEPFRRLKDHISVTLVPAISAHSGVTSIPYENSEKDTYYQVRGFWNDSGYAGFVGTDYPERIWQAAETVTSADRVHLIIMLLNSAMYGGRADPSNRLAYVAIQYQGKDVAAFAAHESAHAFAALADEYATEGDSPDDKYPNVATERQRVEGTVSWKELAYPWELDGHGDFRATNFLGAPVDDDNRPIMPPEMAGMLGLFWGCSKLDPGPETGDLAGDVYRDPRGANYYRPMAVCRMRWLSEPFCRVCEKEIEKRILAASPKKSKGDESTPSAS